MASRTWTTAPEGASDGQTIAGVPVANASAPDTGQAGALRMTVDQVAGSRATLGLVNTPGVTTTVSVEAFTAGGQPAPGGSSVPVGVPPFGMNQVNDVRARGSIPASARA